MNKILVLEILLSLTSISYGNDLNDAFVEASNKGNLKEVKVLIKKGADINFQNEDGNTALIMASGMGQLEVVRKWG